ncbi:MAG: formate dehydrogenase accessory sulfurtransferase FdhD [Bacteroidia bacterium]|nr:formate dehydrogenase accessory sulfurtransferase FdhD [Bacteroidia bacterium]NNC84581.1 formate dehydrogenase accessory sulfurtransferase FdhD [Bacteroidia bacterium]NNM16091.1 formate dehydrogenase accessory sulfurtransferase FdhD [Bacteroidia bacterium]
MATRNYEGNKFDQSLVSDTLDSLSIEEALQININNKAFTVTMRTPGNDECLVRGLLHSEGIIKTPHFLPEIHLHKKEKSIITEADLSIPENELGENYTNSRSLLSVSSCGICGKTELEDITSFGQKINDEESIDIEVVHGLFNKMSDLQHDFHQSGGTHAAVAFTINGDLLCAMEDIGRHNAVDKVIGKLILTQRLKEASCLTVSGRISYEIIIKCFKAGIPFLAAVSAPSSLAVDYAKELGITLFAFCREKRATCYSNAQRVKVTNHNKKAS